MAGDTWTLLVLLLGSLKLVTAGVTDTGQEDHGYHGDKQGYNGKGHVKDDKMSGGKYGSVNTWTYNIERHLLGPGRWNTLFPEDCGRSRRRQSPIDIVTADTVYSDALDPLDVIYPGVPPETPKTEAVAEAEAEAKRPRIEVEVDVEAKAEAEAEVEAKAEGEAPQAKKGQLGKGGAGDRKYDRVEKDAGNQGMLADEGEEDGDEDGDEEGDEEEDGDEEEEVDEEEDGEGAAPGNNGMYLFNNGHTVQVDVERPVYLMGAGLGDQYRAAQFHFHWGKNGSVGSEHRIDGNMFMLEIHMVTYNSERYVNLLEAVGKEKGIAVFSILFKRGKHNDNLNTIVKNLKHVPAPDRGKKLPIDWIDLQGILPARTDRYYRYQGSLTTPACVETVTWTVFADHLTVCPNQMAEFYRVLEGHAPDGSPVALVDNWRPPQPRHGRVVFSSFPARPELLAPYTVQDERQPQRLANPAPAPRPVTPGVLLTAAVTCIAVTLHW